MPPNVTLTKDANRNKTNIEINLKKREAIDDLPNQAFKKAKGEERISRILGMRGDK